MAFKKSLIITILLIYLYKVESAKLTEHDFGCQMRKEKIASPTDENDYRNELENWQAILLIIFFGIFGVFVCLIYRILR